MTGIWNAFYMHIHMALGSRSTAKPCQPYRQWLVGVLHWGFMRLGCGASEDSTECMLLSGSVEEGVGCAHTTNGFGSPS